VVSGTTPLASIVVIAGIIWMRTTAVWALEIWTFIPQVAIKRFTNMAPYVMYFRQTNLSPILIISIDKYHGLYNIFRLDRIYWENCWTRHPIPNIVSRNS